MPKHGEADEARTGAPFENTFLFRHSSRFEKRNELLPELGSSSVELASIADVYPREADVTGWPSPTQERPYQFVLNTL